MSPLLLQPEVSSMLNTVGLLEIQRQYDLIKCCMTLIRGVAREDQGGHVPPEKCLAPQLKCEIAIRAIVSHWPKKILTPLNFDVAPCWSPQPKRSDCTPDFDVSLDPDDEG